MRQEPKVTQTKIDDFHWTLEAEGQTWQVEKAWTAGWTGGAYFLTGEGVEEYLRQNAPGRDALIARDLEGARRTFRHYLDFLYEQELDRRYPALVAAYADAHINSDIDGYGDEGEGYDHAQALVEFMESDAMRAYLEQHYIKRDTED